jgi:hypothetical protein
MKEAFTGAFFLTLSCGTYPYVISAFCHLNRILARAAAFCSASSRDSELRAAPEIDCAPLVLGSTKEIPCSRRMRG